MKNIFFTASFILAAICTNAQINKDSLTLSALPTHEQVAKFIMKADEQTVSVHSEPIQMVADTLNGGYITFLKTCTPKNGNFSVSVYFRKEFKLKDKTVNIFAIRKVLFDTYDAEDGFILKEWVY